MQLPPSWLKTMTLVGPPYPAEVLATMVATCGTNGSAGDQDGVLIIPRLS